MQSIVIEDLQPRLDGGRHPIKREVGDTFEVRATIFKEGHDHIAAVLKLRRTGTATWRETPMAVENPGLDLWRGGCALRSPPIWVSPPLKRMRSVWWHPTRATCTRVTWQAPCIAK